MTRSPDGPTTRFLLALALCGIMVSCRPETELDRRYRAQEQAARELERRRQPLDAHTFFAHIRAGDAELVRLYLAAGMEPDATDHDGLPALHAAIPHREVVEALLDAGADVNAPDGEHESPLSAAIRLGGHYEIAELLLDRGAGVNASGHNGYTPLMYAVDLPRIARMLLQRGADVNARDAAGRSVLMHAVSNSEDVELVRELLARGADVNARNAAGETALMWAAVNPEMVALLLAAGADPNAQAKDGRTALALARRHQVEESVRLLRTAGAKR